MFGYPGAQRSWGSVTGRPVRRPEDFGGARREHNIYSIPLQEHGKPDARRYNIIYSYFQATKFIANVVFGARLIVFRSVDDKNERRFRVQSRRVKPFGFLITFYTINGFHGDWRNFTTN